MLIHRAYRFRFYPTDDQANQLARTFGCARWVYNWGLQRRSSAFFERQERIYYKHLAAELALLKNNDETSWLKEVSSVCLQQALMHLDQAFTRFFKKTGDYQPSSRAAATSRARTCPMRLFSATGRSRWPSTTLH